MKIAIVDVAAESGGALSVLMDFLDYLLSIDDDTNEYYIFVSKTIDIKNNRFHVIQKPEIKKSWFRRLKWELIDAKKEFAKYKIDTIISLQNTGFFFRGFKQIVYFHNVLLLENKQKYSLLNKEERKFAVYTRLIAPYTIRSMKLANTIICQTHTVKDKLQVFLPNINKTVINPNVHIGDEYLNTVIFPIKGFIYPTSAVPFKKIEDIVECVKQHSGWFVDNNLQVLITLSGSENEYSKSIFNAGKDIPVIKFIGYQPRINILEYYKNYALINNSELESFPLPFKEAELIGTPIVSSSYDYVREILYRNEASFIFKSGDINGMFECMKKAYEYRVKHVGSKHLIQENTWKKVCEIL